MLAKVEFEIIAGLYTEFLNFLSNENIVLNNINRTQLGFTAQIDAKEYKKVANYSRKFGCKIKIKEKKGIYFKSKKYTKRKGLIVGVLIFYLLISCFNNMIWRIEVDTYDEDIIENVLKILYENDIYVGKMLNKENFENATQDIFIANSDIGNIALNFYKGVLVCDIDERDKKEEYVEEEGPEYILALMDGTISDLRVYSGFSNIKVGDTVKKGDILVFASSVFLPKPTHTYIPEDFVFPITQQIPRAYITANCNKEYKATIYLNKEVMVLTGEKDSDIFMQFLGFDIKLDTAKIEKENSVAKQKIQSLDIFGFSLPITINKTTYYTREIKTISYSEDNIENIAMNEINTAVNQDERLVKVIDTKYSMEIFSDRIEIKCEVFGEYEISV